jgi:hypothetical protein
VLIGGSFGWKTGETTITLIKVVGGSKKNDIEFDIIAFNGNSRFRVLMLSATTEMDEVVLKSDEGWFEFW